MPDFSELIFQVKNKQAIQDINKVNKSLLQTEKSATNLFKTLAAGWSLTKITQGINFLTNKFRDLQIATNNYAAIFGNFNRTAEQGLNNLINNFNETEVSAKRLLALIGSRIDFDFGANEIGQISADIGRLSRELSTFFGMNIDQVALKLTNALSGQTKGLRELGISIDTTSPKFKALIQNLQDSKGYSEEAAKAYAVYSQILQKTQKYEGSFSKQSTTLFQAIGDLKNTLNSGVFAKAGEILNTLFVPLIKQLNEFFSSPFVSAIAGFQLAIGSVIFGVVSLVKLIENIDKKTDDIQVKTVTTGKLIKNQTKSISETVNKSINVIRSSLTKTEAASQRLLKKQQNLAYMPEVVSYYKKLTKDIYNIDPSDTKKLNEYNQKIWETKKEIQKFQDKGFLSYELTETQRYRRFVKENKEKIKVLNEESAKMAKKSIKIAEVSTKTFEKINFDNVPRGVRLAVDALEESEKLSNTFSVKLNNIGKKIKTSISGIFGKISAIPELFLKMELIQFVWVMFFNIGRTIRKVAEENGDSLSDGIVNWFKDQIVNFKQRMSNLISKGEYETELDRATKRYEKNEISYEQALENIKAAGFKYEDMVKNYMDIVNNLFKPEELNKNQQIELLKEYEKKIIAIRDKQLEVLTTKDTLEKDIENLQKYRRELLTDAPNNQQEIADTINRISQKRETIISLQKNIDDANNKMAVYYAKAYEAQQKIKEFRDKRNILLQQALKQTDKSHKFYRSILEELQEFTTDDISNLKLSHINMSLTEIVEKLKDSNISFKDKFELYKEEQRLIVDSAKIRIDALKKEYQEILKFKDYVISMWDKVTSFINRGVQAIEVGTSSGIAFAGSSTSSYAPISEWLKYSTDKQSSLDEQMKDIQAETQQKVDGIYQEIKQIVPALQNITIIRGVNA